MTDKTGGPAFPVAFTTTPLQGMTLRDYFAAKASDDDIDSIISEFIEWNTCGDQICTISRQQARYIHADAMLSERNKSAQP